jgi:DNA mismatch repair ATPase MutS
LNENSLVTFQNAQKVWDELQIFSRAQHPSLLIQNTIKQTELAKEGFSIFGLYDFTVTESGRRYLKQIFMQPTIDLKLIRER